MLPIEYIAGILNNESKWVTVENLFSLDYTHKGPDAYSAFRLQIDKDHLNCMMIEDWDEARDLLESYMNVHAELQIEDKIYSTQMPFMTFIFPPMFDLHRFIYTRGAAWTNGFFWQSYSEEYGFTTFLAVDDEVAKALSGYNSDGKLVKDYWNSFLPE